MEQANNLTMYPTKGPIVYGMVNGRMMGVQLTAISDPEQASKFLALYEKQQKLQKAGKQEGQEGQKPAGKENSAPAGDQETPQEDPLERVKKLAEQGFVTAQPVELSLVLWEGRLINPDRRVEFIPIEDFIDPRVAGLQPVPPPPLEVMSAGPVPVADMQMVQPAVAEDVAEQVVQAPVQVEELPVEEVQVAEEQVVEEIMPQEQDDEQVEAADGEQAPQQVFHDVEAAPVKVGETYRPEETEAPDLTAQISSQLAEAAANQQSRVQIQLTPANLGKVTINIAYDKNGVVQAVLLSAERGETRDLLHRHTQTLQSLLSKSGEEPVRVEVQHQEEAQQKNFYDGRNGHSHQQEQRREQRKEHEEHDFLQQLRLGLIPTELD